MEELLDEDITKELELLATDELLRDTLELLLGFELDEDIAKELELLAADELLVTATLDNGTSSELELGLAYEELESLFPI
jgi:hypothetical protein